MSLETTQTALIAIVGTLLASEHPIQTLIQPKGMDERTVASGRDQHQGLSHNFATFLFRLAWLDMVTDP